MARHSVLFSLVCALAAFCGCGGKNGLVGGGKGNSVFLTSISLTPVNPTLALTASPQAPATKPFVVIGNFNVGNPKDITDRVTWSSRDTKVATVDSKGIATAVASGRVIIVCQIFEPATQKTYSASTVLTVVPQLTGITVSPSSAAIAKGTSQQFAAVGDYNDGTHVDVTALVAWNSSQPGVATVSSAPGTPGMALAGAPGSTNITASSGSVSSSAAALTVTNAKLVSLAVTPANSVVPLASSQQFAATGHFDDGSNQNITATARWTSSNPAIARVSSAGLVAGLGLGDTNITASSGAVSDSTTVSVDASSVVAVSVLPVSKIANNTLSQMRATAIFKDGSSLEATHIAGIVWSSSDHSVATIAADTGLANAAGPGSAIISAKLGSQSGSTTLNVSDATIQAVAVAPNQAVVAPGTTENVIALATFSDGTGQFQQDISSAAAWSSDDPSVATVSYVNGLQELARGLVPGVANISASFSDAHGNLATSSASLNVSAATISGIDVRPGDAAITFGGGHQYVATANLSDGTQQDLTLIADWTASNGDIATVSRFGFASASGPGQTNITATLGSQSGSSSLLVNPGALVKIDICAGTVSDPLNNCPPLDPLISPPPVSFAKLVPYNLIAIGTFTDGTREDLTSSVRWTSSNPAMASVSNDPGIPGYVTGVAGQGAVTGFSSGHVTVNAATGGITGSLDVIVTDATPAFLTVTPANIAIPLGLTQPMSVMATFSDSTTENVTPYVQWTTSNPAIAVVYPGGLVYTSGTGVANVTATLSGIVGGTTVTVQ